ncbi:MAG: type 1 glutamine amidotransferase, partial [Armatimonadetes bacterium]|nr:type 1 glutamine amidotransferase [Armatimonadota bacterium]
DGEGFPDPGDVRAVVVLGGPMNVYQEAKYAFLAQEDRFIREVVGRGIPYLGVCLGAQLLAKALGARVYASSVKEIGYYSLELTDAGQSDALLAGVPNPFTAFQWHGDTFDLPGGAELLATSATCPHQAFRYGQKAYGLQFHLEAGPEMVADWSRRYPRELASVGLNAPTLEAAATQYEEGLRRLRQLVLGNFLSRQVGVRLAAAQ